MYNENNNKTITIKSLTHENNNDFVDEEMFILLEPGSTLDAHYDFITKWIGDDEQNYYSLPIRPQDEAA